MNEKISKKKQDLLNGTAVYFIGNVLTQIISLFLLKYVTGNITSDAYGYFNLVVTIDNLITPMITLQISDAVFKFMIRTECLDDKKKYYTVGTITIAVGAGFVACLIYGFKGVLGIQLPGLVALYIISTNVFSYNQKVVRALGKNTYYVISNLIKAVLYIILQFVFVVALKMGITGLFLANIISTFFCVLTLMIVAKTHQFFELRKFRGAVMLEMVRFSAPLIPNTAVWWMQASVNSLIISSVLGMGFNGIYSVSNKFASILNLVISVFSMAWQESAIKEYGSKEYKRFATEALSMYSIVLFSGIAILVPVMYILMPMMIDHSYYDALIYAPFLLFSTAISAFSGYFGSMITAMGTTKNLLYTNALGAITNIIIVWMFVNVIGIWAVVVSAIVSNMILACSRYYYVKDSILLSRIDFRVFAVAFLLACVSCVVYFNLSRGLNYFMLFVALVSFMVLNKEFVLGIIKILKNKIMRT